MKKVTAGRDFLGHIAPDFARFNDDILFGEVWVNEILSPKTRSIITISSLITAGLFDENLKGHMQTGKENGITKDEMIALITHLAFYTGWPKGWSAFALLMEIYEDDNVNSILPHGKLIDGEDAKHFTGNVYEEVIVNYDTPMNVVIGKVAFEKGARNYWHSHASGQVLIVTDGEGWYQEEGKEAIKLKVGDVVEILPNVKHWHGASSDHYLVHYTFEPDVSAGWPSWYEEVSDEIYNSL